jgi:hypothetical protein
MIYLLDFSSLSSIYYEYSSSQLLCGVVPAICWPSPQQKTLKKLLLFSKRQLVFLTELLFCICCFVCVCGGGDPLLSRFYIETIL